MAQFNYKARRRNGEMVQGVLDVADRAAVLEALAADAQELNMGY